MWTRIRSCQSSLSEAPWLAAAWLAAALALGGCEAGPEPAEPEVADENAERARVRDFWGLSREANRLRLAGEYEAAIESFEAALAIDPEHADSLYYLGVSLEQTGSYGRAEQVYRRMIEVNPRSNRAIAQLASLLSLAAPGAQPNLAEARALLLRAVEINREHSGPYLELGRLDLAEGDPRRAIEHFTTAARFGSAEGDLMVGVAHLLRGERSAAEARFRSVIGAAELERERSRRGEKSEGDVRTSSGVVAGPLQASAARAEVLLAPPSQGEWKDFARAAGLPTDGGRAAWADFDGDGWTDVLVCGPGPARLLRNVQGRFQAVAAPAVAAIREAWDAVPADVDSDGDLDLYLTRSGFVGFGENRLLRNDGGLAFTDITEASGLGAERATSAAAFADLDADGRPELIEAGASSDGFSGLRIFRRREDGWQDVTDDWGAGVFETAVDFEIVDFDGDGRLDLFVLPWKRNVVLLSGRPNGGFIDVTNDAGLANLRNSALSVAAADFDRDDKPDLLWIDHADFASPATPKGTAPGGGLIHLYRNRGKRTFERIAIPNAPASIRAMQILMLDFDSDGYGDAAVANGGLKSDSVGRPGLLWSLRGIGPEMSFFKFGAIGNAIGISAADPDGDGSLAIYIAKNRSLFPSIRGASDLVRR